MGELPVKELARGYFTGRSFVRYIFKLLYEVSYDERRKMDDTTKNALVGGIVGGIAWLVIRHFWEKHKFKKELHESLEELKYRLKYDYRY